MKEQEVSALITSDQFTYGLLIMESGMSPFQQAIAIQNAVISAGENATAEYIVEVFKNTALTNLGLTQSE